MRISELSRRSEVPVATVKFYLREGLLHDGVLTSATQAQYDDSHVDRLRLIRALLGAGGLSIASARAVIAAIADPPSSAFELLGIAAGAVTRSTAPRDHHRVHALMRSWGWMITDENCGTHDVLEETLAAFDDAGFDLPEEVLDRYQAQMSQVAQAEIDSVPTESAGAAVRFVVLGTVLVEPLLLILRRMAQQELSGRRFGSAEERIKP